MDTWQNHGLSFSYPDSWTISEEGNSEGWTITLTSPGTAFWTMVLLRDRPDPQDVLDSAVAAFEEEYDELDVYDVDDSLCGRACAASEVDFVCMELLNTACIRSVRLNDKTVFVLWQATDLELDDTRHVMEAITVSLQEGSGGGRGTERDFDEPEYDGDSFSVG